MKALYHMTANSPWGKLGDYFWANSRVEAERAFVAKHGMRPSWVEIERIQRRAA